MLVALRTRRWRGSVSAHRGAVGFLFASALLNVSNLAFHLVVSRIIGPGRYGALSALVVVTGLLAIPLGALQTASTHAQAGAPAGSDARRLVRGGFLLGAAVLVVGVACAPSLGGIFHLRSPVPGLLLAAWLGLSVAAAVPTGLLFGQGRFAAAGVSLLAGGGVVRLIAGAVLSGPMGVAGGMLGTAIGAGVTLVIVLCAIRGQLVAPSDPPLRMSRTIGALSLAALVGLALLTGLDTILARNLMSSVQSGVYASAAVAGRIALFAPGAIALVAFPHFAEAYKRDADDARLLGWSLGLIVVIGAGATAVLSAAPGLVISLMFGSRYADAASLVGPLAVEGAALGVLSLLIYYLISRESPASLAAWLGCAAVAALGFARTPAPRSLAVLMAVSVCSLTALVLARVAVARQGERRSRSLRPPARSLAAVADDDTLLTLVVPCFNPGPALRLHIEAVIAGLDAMGVSYEIIPVSDGSTDGSEATLDGLRPDVVRPEVLPDNAGKGEALCVGLSRGRGRYLGFIDADGDIPAAMMATFVDVVMAADPHFAIGCKRHPGSEVSYPAIRRVYSWGYQQLVRLLFGVDARDTQTGLKIVRRDALAAVLPRTLEKRFAFDLELLVVARRLGFRNVIELPVRVTQRYGSTIGVREVWRVLQDTLAIFYRLRILRYYDAPKVGPSGATPAGVAPAPTEAVG